jgi:hypothetical protein
MYSDANSNSRQQCLVTLNGGLLEFEYAIPSGFSAITSPVQEERNFVTLKSTPISTNLTLLSNGLTVLENSDGGSAIVDVTPKSSGKWYFEVEVDFAINDNIGMGWSSILSPTPSQLTGDGIVLSQGRPGQNVGDLGAGFSGYNRPVYHNGVLQGYDNSVDQLSQWRTVYGCAIDIDNGRIWFGNDNDSAYDGYMNWSGDPEAGTGGWTFPAMAGQTLIPWVYSFGSDAPTRAYARLRSDALRYAPPSGFGLLEGDYADYYGWDENNKNPSITISENGSRASKPNEDLPLGQAAAVYGKLARGEGKKYIEFVLNEDAIYRLRFGICTETLSLSAATYTDKRRAVILGSLLGDRRIIEWGPGANNYEYNVGWVNGPVGTVIGIAIDFRTGEVWIVKDGTWYDATGTNGDPENGLNPVITLDKIYKMKPIIFCGAQLHASGDAFDITLRTKDSEYQYKPVGFTEW